MLEFKIANKNVEAALGFTDRVVKKCPGRLTGTESSIKTAEMIYEEFLNNCDPETVKKEAFQCHPTAFLKFIRPMVVLFSISSVLMLTASLTGNYQFVIVAFAGYLIAAAMLYSQLLKYYGWFDPIFKKETGYNVYGTIEPKEEVKQQIIICGHHDAAYVLQILANMPKLYVPIMIGVILSIAFGFIISAIETIIILIGHGIPEAHFAMSVALVVLIPLVGIFWVFTTNEISPAASDNMIASALANEVAKVFSEQKKAGNGLKHTRIIPLSVDAEEAGLRGSRAYCKKHKREMKDIKTYAFVMDTLITKTDISFIKSDLNGLVRLSKEMALECNTIAKELGYESKVINFPFGGGATDAAEWGKIKVEATCLLGIDATPRGLAAGSIYHTSRDLVENIEPGIVEAALNITKEYILTKDRKET
ncbi:MAG: Zn-dependent exopeptidase M28 [Proteobacteria bacterium]|nr:Zn-dependent exopeptidase M28 [Pseudomonadota bacterium]